MVPRSFHYVARRAKTGAKKKSGHFGRDDGEEKTKSTGRSASATLFVQVAADLFDLGQNAEGVFAQDFVDVGFGVAFFEEGVGDLGDVGDVLHA